MLPHSLKFAGINSYANPVFIDFTKFHSSKLFGIFGETGGGKSTILDAIILSIYGKTPRLPGRVDEAINPRRKKIEIEFIFEISGKKFKIERILEITRSSGEIKKTAKLFKLTHEKWIPISDKFNETQQKLQDTIGLSYDEFCKVVILPQNQFAELLRLKPADRAVLIGNLFDLYYFGEPIYDKFSQMYSSLEALKNEKQRRLNEISEISQESIAEKENNLYKIEEELKLITSMLNNKTQELNILKNYKQLLHQKNKLEEELRKIEEKQTEIEQLKTKIHLDNTISPYKKLIDELDNLNFSINEKSNKKAIIEKILSETEDIINKKKVEKDEFEKFFSTRNEELIIKIKEAEQLQELENEIKSLLEKIKHKDLICKDYNNTLEKIEEELKKIESDTTKLIKNKEKTEVELKNTQFSQSESELYDKLPDALIKLNEIRTLKNDINRLDNKIKKEKEIETNEFIKIINEFKKTDIIIDEFENIDEIISNKINLLKEERENLLKRLDELKIQNSSYILSKSLVAGKPCPVCGSPSHPAPAKSIDENEINLINENLKKIDNNITNIDNIKKSLKPTIDKISKAKTNLQTYSYDLNEKKDKLLSLENKLLSILSKEYWDNAEDLFEKLRSRKKMIEESKNKINEYSSLFNDLMTKKFEKSNEKTKINSELKIITQEINELKSQIEEKKANLYKRTSGISPLTIKQNAHKELEQLKLKRIQLESEFKQLEKKINDLKLENESITSTINIETKRRDQILSEIESKAKEIGIEPQKISSLILEEKYKKQIQEQIEEFEQKIYQINGAIDNISKNLAEIKLENYSDELLSETEKQVKELNDKINGITESIGTIKEQIRTEKTLLQEKVNLSQEIKSLDKDFQLVKTLKDLTYGKEMVKFFSWHLLKEVVTLANQILSTILGRRFYLKVNSNLDFNVLDLYYNNERSVNTLSGGETFVVSFALALALSSYIQSRRRKTIQFFFIDEGFSSLDSDLFDSVSVVLNELKSQDRLVGFITHVNEIKQLISSYIEVKKDNSGSSTIKMNSH